jgi:hypothetical protein
MVVPVAVVVVAVVTVAVVAVAVVVTVDVSVVVYVPTQRNWDVAVTQSDQTLVSLPVTGE